MLRQEAPNEIQLSRPLEVDAGHVVQGLATLANQELSVRQLELELANGNDGVQDALRFERARLDGARGILAQLGLGSIAVEASRGVNALQEASQPSPDPVTVK